MSSRYTRPPSPPDRRERGSVAYSSTDPYYARSSRSSGVIPVSTQTFVNGVPVVTRSAYDTYTDPRRSIGTIPSDSPERRTSVTGRTRAAVIHNGSDRPPSPSMRTSTKYRYDDPYQVTPESSTVSRGGSKKIYAVEGGRSKDVDERDFGRKGYHLSGPAPRGSGDGYGRYDRGDSRALYVDTETRTRPRRESVDAASTRHGSIDGFGIIVPRTSGREAGPPPTTRGLEKIGGVITRHGSIRETDRSPQHYRERGYSSYSDDDDGSVLSAKLMPTSQNPLIYERGPFSPNRDEFNDRFDNGPRRPNYEDSDVASRGFGIRSGGAGVGYLRESGREAVPHLEPGAGAVPYPRTSNVDLRSDYGTEPSTYGPRDDVRPDPPRNERRRDPDVRDRDIMSDRSRDQGESRKARHSDYDTDSRYRHRRDRDKERYEDEEPRARDRRSDRDDHSERGEKEKDKDRDDRRARHDDSITPEVLTALAGGAAAFGAKELFNRRERDKTKDAPDREEREKRERNRERDKERDRVDREERDRRPRDPQESEREREKERERDHERDREREQRNRERDRERDRLRELDEREDREKRAQQSRDAAAAAASVPAPPPPVVTDREITERRPAPIDEDAPRQHNYVTRNDRQDRAEEQSPPRSGLDPDEEYRQRVLAVQAELERSKHARGDNPPPDLARDPIREEESRRRHHDDRGLEERTRQPPEDVRRPADLPQATMPPADGQSVAPYGDPMRQNSMFEGPLTEEPSDFEGSQGSGDRRVRIVEPPKDGSAQPPIKSILRRPTDKFPEHPTTVREGVAPLKDVAKKGIPPGARWTKIDRRLVNPDALEEAKERYEERSDSVIVLRVLTKEEIQKFAERTKEIRDERYEQRHKRRDQDGVGDDPDDRKDDEDKDKPKQLTWDG